MRYSHSKNPPEHHAHLQSQQMSLWDANSGKGVVHLTRRLETPCMCMLRRACVVLSVGLIRRTHGMPCRTRHRTPSWDDPVTKDMINLGALSWPLYSIMH